MGEGVEYYPIKGEFPGEGTWQPLPSIAGCAPEIIQFESEGFKSVCERCQPKIQQLLIENEGSGRP
jgi:hypothetical protein